MTRSLTLTLLAGAACAALSLPAIADRECFPPLCQKQAKPVEQRPTEAQPVRFAEAKAKPDRVVDVSRDIAAVDADNARKGAPKAGNSPVLAPERPARRHSEERVIERAPPKRYDTIEVVRERVTPEPVVVERPGKETVAAETVRGSDKEEPAAPAKKYRVDGKLYDTVEFVRHPAPEPEPVRRYDTVEIVRERAPARPQAEPRYERRETSIAAPVRHAPARHAPVYVGGDVYGVGELERRERARDLSRPLYGDVPRPAKVVEQGPVYDTYAGPKLMARQVAPAYAAPVVVADQGYAYGAGAVVVASPDPALRSCQVDGRVRGTVLCSPYSYRPYGTPGYRPYGTYQEPVRYSDYSYGSDYAGYRQPDARIIHIAPGR